MVVPVASVDHAVLTSYERDQSVDLTAEPTPVLANFTAPTAALASRVPSVTQDRVRVSNVSSLSYVLIASFTARINKSHRQLTITCHLRPPWDGIIKQQMHRGFGLQPCLHGYCCIYFDTTATEVAIFS